MSPLDLRVPLPAPGRPPPRSGAAKRRSCGTGDGPAGGGGPPVGGGQWGRWGRDLEGFLATGWSWSPARYASTPRGMHYRISNHVTMFPTCSQLSKRGPPADDEDLFKSEKTFGRKAGLPAARCVGRCWWRKVILGCAVRMGRQPYTGQLPWGNSRCVGKGVGWSGETDFHYVPGTSPCSLGKPKTHRSKRGQLATS